MFFTHFKLESEPELTNFEESEKKEIISIAINKARQNNPLSKKLVLALLFGVWLGPALLFFFFVRAELSFIWLFTVIWILNYKISQIEIPKVRPFIPVAIDEFNKSRKAI